MIWNICFPLSVAIMVAGLLIALRLARRKDKQNNETIGFFVMAVSVFLSLTIMYFALEISGEHEQERGKIITAIFVAIRDTIGTFVVDGDFAFYGENMQGMSTWMVPICSSIMSVMIIAAPVFTFGFLLSFFKNLNSMLRFSLRKRADIYMFTELNEKSLVLAKDIKKNGNRRVIVFCDVFEDDDERSGEMLAQAKRLNAILIKQDILELNLKRHAKKGNLYFFVTGDDDAENINQTLGLIREYGQMANTNLYLFSDSVSGELLLFNGKHYKMKVRRVNESLAMIQRTLYNEPASIFEHAHATTPDGDKIISAVIVGLGGYGVETLKTLLWYGQMEGYRLHIDAFDKDPDAEQRIAYMCPEVMSEQYNGVYVPGESYYKVAVHGGVRVGTSDFAREISKMTEASFVLISLGNDDLNIETAVSMRMIFERMGIRPEICAVVHNSALSSCLKELTNYRGQPYNIRFIGELEESYSEEVIMRGELETDALEIHCVGYGGDEADFFAYEYNYRSSAASALHNKARIKLGVLGADLPPEQRSKEQEHALMVLEHRRWNAYMRSIGYVYSGSEDPSTRNDLAKMHHNLVCFDRLTQEDKDKDKYVGNVNVMDNHPEKNQKQQNTKKKN